MSITEATKQIKLASNGEQIIDNAVYDILNFAERFLPHVAERHPQRVTEFATQLKKIEAEMSEEDIINAIANPDSLKKSMSAAMNQMNPSEKELIKMKLASEIPGIDLSQLNNLYEQFNL